MLLVYSTQNILFSSETIPGSVADIDEIFPPRHPPVKRVPTNVPPSKPQANAAGAVLCTPDNGHNTVRNPGAPQIQRTGTTLAGREPL